MQPQQAEQFAALWTAAHPTIAAFIRTLIPDYQQADEVLQRVAVTLVRKFDQYDQSRSFTAWAVGFAKYEVLYYRRERATDKHLFGDAIVEQIAIRYEVLAEDVDPVREALRAMPRAAERAFEASHRATLSPRDAVERHRRGDDALIRSGENAALPSAPKFTALHRAARRQVGAIRRLRVTEQLQIEKGTNERNSTLDQCVS